MDGGSGRSTAKQPAEGGWVTAAEQRIVKAAQEGRLSGMLWRFCRKATFGLVVVYAAFLALVWMGSFWLGERNITTAFLLYAPPAIWLLPVVPLAALCLIFYRRCLLGLVGLVAIVGWGWMGFRVAPPKPWAAGPAPGVLTVMTYNRGQHMNQSLQPFKAATAPDVLTMQEAAGRAPGFLNAPAYSEFTDAKNIGEFTLLSRFPIKHAEVVPAGVSPYFARAARFVIDWNGRLISIYSVHLQTPREVLRAYRGGAFLYGLLGMPGTPWNEKRLHYQAFWNRQIDDAQAILDAVRRDPHPAIVAGDFNAPHVGLIHRLIAAELGDAHAEAGSGFGFTFPGATHNPLSAGGPWLRIDYVFFNRSWQAVSCLTESDRPSQHRAVVAKLLLKP